MAVLWVSSSPSCSPALTLQRIQGRDVGLLPRLLLCGDVLVTQKSPSKLASLATLSEMTEFGDAPTAVAGLGELGLCC